MLYAKKAKSKKDILLSVLFYGSISSLVFVYFLYGYTSIIKITGSSEKVNDVITSIGQIATAAAFCFAVYQYKKNGEKEQQLQLSNELKGLILKIENLCDSFVKDEKHTIQCINSFISKVTNLGGDFHVLYAALNEDIQKAIIRMYWQNMFFNHLRIVLKRMTINSVFENQNLEKEFGDYGFFQARFNENTKHLPNFLQEYQFTKNVLDNMSISDEIISSFDDMFLFKQYFLDDEMIKDLLYGTISKVDIRVVAPLLAAVDEAKSNPKPKRDKA